MEVVLSLCPNIVCDLPEPVIPYAKTVEFMPFITLSIRGTTTSSNTSALQFDYVNILSN